MTPVILPVIRATHRVARGKGDLAFFYLFVGGEWERSEQKKKIKKIG